MVSISSSGVICWDIVGAFRKAHDDLKYPWKGISHFLFHSSDEWEEGIIEAWNDDPKRKYEDVIKMIDGLIAEKKVIRTRQIKFLRSKE